MTAEYLHRHTRLRSETFDEDHLWRFCLSSDSQDGFPIRIKAVNIINEPRIFKGIFAIIKPFLKEKMAERVTIVLELFLSLLFMCLAFIHSLGSKQMHFLSVRMECQASSFF